MKAVVQLEILREKTMAQFEMLNEMICAGIPSVFSQQAEYGGQVNFHK